MSKHLPHVVKCLNQDLELDSLVATIRDTSVSDVDVSLQKEMLNF